LIPSTSIFAPKLTWRQESSFEKDRKIFYSKQQKDDGSNVITDDTGELGTTPSEQDEYGDNSDPWYTPILIRFLMP